jgi:hypothetical protein
MGLPQLPWQLRSLNARLRSMTGPSPKKFISLLLTVNVEKSTSGLKRAVRIGVGRQTV